MNTAQRILTCRLLGKMEQQEEYGRKLGLEDVSVFRFRPEGKCRTKSDKKVESK